MEPKKPLVFHDSMGCKGINVHSFSLLLESHLILLEELSRKLLVCMASIYRIFFTGTASARISLRCGCDFSPLVFEEYAESLDLEQNFCS